MSPLATQRLPKRLRFLEDRRLLISHLKSLLPHRREYDVPAWRLDFIHHRHHGLHRQRQIYTRVQEALTTTMTEEEGKHNTSTSNNTEEEEELEYGPG